LMIGFRFCRKVVREHLTSLAKSDDYKKTWGQAYAHHLKQSSAWEKVEVFVSGGGARLPYIKTIFAEPWWQNLSTTYQVDLLPEPDDYDVELFQAPFERIAVAYGLAILKPMLDQFKLPSEAPDHTPPKLPVLDLSHEDLYLK